MTLVQSLTQYCIENLTQTNDWYTWKINEKNIPVKIDLPKGNHYQKNLTLKYELNKAWKTEADKIKKGEIIKYYIEGWGGIKSNSDDKMKDYMYSSPEYLLDYGGNGIASWSKALVIHNPDKYAIFDARVSISLNCLQIVYKVGTKKLFPNIGSRNKKVKEGQKLIKDYSNKNRWEKVNKTTFYLEYLSLLKEVTVTTNTNLSTIEMLLFSKAEELVNKIKNLA
ncbi:MAG: hypothetical protein AB2L13_10845 [Spirochaetota bacterium]